MPVDLVWIIGVVLGLVLLVYILRQVIGPPNFPAPVVWIVWAVVILVVLYAVANLLGLSI